MRKLRLIKFLYFTTVRSQGGNNTETQSWDSLTPKCSFYHANAFINTLQMLSVQQVFFELEKSSLIISNFKVIAELPKLF